MFSKPYNSREDQIFRGGLLLVMIKLRSDSGTEEIIMQVIVKLGSQAKHPLLDYTGHY